MFLHLNITFFVHTKTIKNLVISLMNAFMGVYVRFMRCAESAVGIHSP